MEEFQQQRYSIQAVEELVQELCNPSQFAVGVVPPAHFTAVAAAPFVINEKAIVFALLLSGAEISVKELPAATLVLSVLVIVNVLTVELNVNLNMVPRFKLIATLVAAATVVIVSLTPVTFIVDVKLFTPPTL